MSNFLDDIMNAINEISNEMNRHTTGNTSKKSIPHTQHRNTLGPKGDTKRGGSLYNAAKDRYTYTGSLGTQKGSIGIEGNPVRSGSLGGAGELGKDGNLTLGSKQPSNSSKIKPPIKKERQDSRASRSLLADSTDFSNLSQNDILQGIILSEILGKPRALRKGRL